MKALGGTPRRRRVNDRFWMFTELNMVTVLADKHDSIMQNRNPAPPMLF